MGRQLSVVQLTGSVGNLTFYKTKDGFFARQKPINTSRQVFNSARILENMSEFSRVVKASKLIRTALRDVLVKKADGNMPRRLSKALMEVLHSDPISDRGARTVDNGEMARLKKFEFNENGRVFASFHVPFTSSIDRATGVFTVDIPAFTPNTMLEYPDRATHVKLKISAVSLDFQNESYLTSTIESEEISVKALQQEAIQLTRQLPTSLETPLLLTFGIDFYQQVNAKQYPLENGAFNGIVIVETDQVTG